MSCMASEQNKTKKEKNDITHEKGEDACAMVEEPRRHRHSMSTRERCVCVDCAHLLVSAMEPLSKSFMILVMVRLRYF